VVVAHLSYVGH